jgi:predicted protein tyrosine phosphatase
MKKTEHERIINLARDTYQDDDIEIDDNAKISIVENDLKEPDGYWVAAWVWIDAR